MNQCQKILKYVKEFGSISQLEAMRDLGIMRLAARIMELERDGFNIIRERCVTKNRYGEQVRYTRYHIKGKSKM